MKREVKRIKHQFTNEELLAQNNEYRQAIKRMANLEADLTALKADYKARIAGAQALADGINANLDAGFEFQERRCVVIFRPEAGEKDYFDENDYTDEKLKKDAVVLLTEPMTNEDRQMELFDAESKFELKDAIVMFPPSEDGQDNGVLVVGQFKDKWYGAVRATVGSQKMEERLDSEQKGFKVRFDAITKAVERFAKWVTEKRGKEAADGFGPELDKVLAAHKDRVE